MPDPTNKKKKEAKCLNILQKKNIWKYKREHRKWTTNVTGKELFTMIFDFNIVQNLDNL